MSLRVRFRRHPIKSSTTLLSVFLVCRSAFVHLSTTSVEPNLRQNVGKLTPGFRSTSVSLVDKKQCEFLVVRTQFGQQSESLDACKTPKLAVRHVCLPLCGSQAFRVTVAESSGNDEVRSEDIGQCKSPIKVRDRNRILVVFKTTRVFNGFHMYHVLNNLVVNLDPDMLDRYDFYCWDCSIEFSEFFDRVMNINSKLVKAGCYEHYIFLGEHYTTYNVDRRDIEKSNRWQKWAQKFQSVWCPGILLGHSERYFTLLDRRNAQNGRNMNDCKLQGRQTKYVVPSLENVGSSSAIFCNSRMLISAEGNGLTNMILMPLGSTIVVLFQSNRAVETLEVIYGNMAKLLGMNMVAIPVESDSNLNVNCTARLNDLFRVLL